VSVYADVTLEPWSVMYVPVGGARMRTYRRWREGDSGTTGAAIYAGATIVAVGTPGAVGTVGTTGVVVPVGNVIATGAVRPTGTVAIVSPSETAVATSGTLVPVVVAPGTVAAGTVALGTRRTRASGTRSTLPLDSRATPGTRALGTRSTMASGTLAPGTNNGVWLEFAGHRWYSDGAAATYSADRFQAVGEYRGFVVYRDVNSRKDEIWIAAVKDGALAPYATR
jgi:hypothetical protein